MVVSKNILANKLFPRGNNFEMPKQIAITRQVFEKQVREVLKMLAEKGFMLDITPNRVYQ